MIELRDLESKDESLLVEYLNNDDVVRYLSSRLPSPYTQKDAKWWVNIGSKEDGIVKAIDYKGVFCGVVGSRLQHFEYERSAEVGYWIAQQYWGKGIASVALTELTDFIFSTTKITRLFAPVFCKNEASKRVLEKSGFVKEAVFKQAIYKNGRYYDEHHFSKTRPI